MIGIIGFILFLIGAIGITIVFPPLILAWIIFIGLVIMSIANDSKY